MEILGKIFGNPARIKLMRLFLVNRAKNFNSQEIVKRSRVSRDSVRRELNVLHSAGFLKKRGPLWHFNPAFRYTAKFEDLLLGAGVLSQEAILENFKKAGRLKLVIISGVFTKNQESRADLLIVGDRLSRAKVEEGVKKIEAEIGSELSYAVFDTKEFLYRLGMYDKLVRDILDFPHEVVLQARELSTPLLKKD